MLSHANLIGNIESIQMATGFGKHDSVCATLPFFHGFGLLTLLWWPILKGTRVAYHPNPLQAKVVVDLIRKEKLTALISTPTFLSTYARKANPEDFKTLQTIITGGERLRPAFADQFAEKFGIRPHEGYGCTELSPVALLNLKKANKPGTAGLPLPGIALQIRHPDTDEIRGENEEGLLFVKGANVMQGYLNEPEKTAEVLRDGWYCTGDIAQIDSRGFVTLTGRLSRFSKIGGEMVPHERIETALHEATQSDEPCLAVLGIPDPAKGEQLAVCHTTAAGDPKELIKKLREMELPNLWIPRAQNFFLIDELPLLGTGKLDLNQLKKIVEK